MKKLLAVLLAVLMLFSVAACGSNEAGSDTGVQQADIVLITDAKSVDDKGFNEYSWKGVLAYCEDHPEVTNNYYMPTEQTTEQYLAQIASAVAGGAKVIVCPGYLFGDAIAEAQFTYPDVYFICVDFTPADCQANAVGALFEEEESGFLAGYAAVKDGYTKLGFDGAMAVPAVKNFGYGYLAGAEAAAEELGLADGAIEVKYSYTGEFAEKPEYVTTDVAWYTAGTQVIFGCGSPRNAFDAADQYNASATEKVAAIGVDSDCSDQSEAVITSAMKNLTPVVKLLIESAYEGTFPGGTEQVYNINQDASALPMATSKFKTFSQADYDAIVERLKTEESFRTALPTAADYNTCAEYVASGNLSKLVVDIVKDSE